MEEEIKDFFNRIVETLFPSGVTCFLCGEEVWDDKHVLCSTCEKEVKFPSKFCLRCGTPLHSLADYCLTCKNNKRYFAMARAPLVYKDKVAGAIKRFKYENKRYMAKYFANFMAEEFERNKNEIGEIDFLIPVPLHEEKEKERGFNQSKLLADELSKMIGIPVLDGNLIRVKNTQTQTELSYKERQENLEKAFKVLNWREIKGKRIVLIDDVLTTGSTLNHCAHVLSNSGAAAVYALTAATTDSEREDD